mgnify:CR=1 FL=1
MKEGRAPDNRLTVELTPHRQFVALLALVLIVGGLALALLTVFWVQAYHYRETYESTRRAVEIHFQSLFDHRVFHQLLTPDQYATFDRIVRLHFDVYDIVEAEFYRPDGLIMYSYAPSRVGQSFSEPALLARVVAGEPVERQRWLPAAALVTPVAPRAKGYAGAYGEPAGRAAEHAVHAAGGSSGAAGAGAVEVLELFVPVREGETVVGVARVARDLRPLHAGLRQVQLVIAGAVFGLALALFLTLRRSYLRATARLLAQEEARQRAEAQAAAMAELARLKDEFLGMVTHDLRNPLTLIRGYLELLEYADPPPDQRAVFLRQAAEAAERLDRLVSDLLDVTSLSAGRFRIQPESIDLYRLVEETVAELRIRPPHTVVVRSEGPAERPPVVADPGRIRQVLVNLLTNAVNYSPQGGTITVTVTYGPESVTVSVADQGVGIPPDKLDQVFERFTRLEHGGVRVKGSGLGLAIARQIVELHGGRIWAESAGEGKGACFTFSLPLRPAVGPTPGQSLVEAARPG